MNQPSSRTHLTWIDSLRGFALLCIVYGHASRDVGLFARAVYAFHVPLCVFITGYLYQWKDLCLKNHLKKTGQRLLIPYFLWSLISMGIYLILGELAAGALGAEIYSFQDNLLFMLKGLSIGNAPLWYLPFLFSLQLLVFFLFRLLRGKTAHSALENTVLLLGPVAFSLITLWIYGKYQYIYSLDLPFGINNACFLLGFFFIGYWTRNNVSLPSGKKWLICGFLLVLVSLFCALTFNDEVEYMSFDHSEYGRNIFVFYSMAAAACLGFCWIFQNFGSLPLLQWFGKNAMAIFLMHKFPILFFQILLGDLSDRMGNFRCLLFLAVSLLSMVLCCLASMFFRRFFPWAIGESGK